MNATDNQVVPLLLIYSFYATIKQMSENKNAQPHSNKDRLLLGAGAAVVGAAVLASVTTANEIGSVDTSYASSELPSYDQSASQTAVHLEPVISNSSLTEQSSNQTPTFKGKITIKKSVTSSLPTAEKTAPTTLGLNDIKPIGVVLPPPPVENTPSTIEKVSLHPENMIVPENVKAIMDRDAVYLAISDGACSGSLVRSKTGEAIGVVTAEHCNLRGSGEDSTPRQPGTDGKSYIVTNAPVEALSGPDQSHLKSAGVVKEFFLPAKNDVNIDIAFGAFDGHTSQEVVTAYNHNKLSDAELSKLKFGDRMYVSGWPANQPNNDGNFERQNFPLSYLGEDMVTTSLSETIHMIWAAVPTSKDGADCSFGDSGGKAFVMEGVHSRSVGVMSVFVDFTGKLVGNAEDGAKARKYFEDKYGADLGAFDAVCGIATETPSTDNGGEVIKPVVSYSEVPLQHGSDAELLIQKAIDEFFDPNYVKTWVSGAINLHPNGTGNWKMNPVIFYDKESGSAVIASYTDNAKDSLELDYVPDFKDQKFYGQAELNIIGGELDVFTGMFGSNGFVGKAGGAVIGQSMNDPSTIESAQKDPMFSVYFDDATQSLQIMQYK